MSIPYVVAGSRVPGFYLEADFSQLNTGSLLKRLLVVGQKLPAGNAPALVPVRCNAGEGAALFGRGSNLQLMCDMVHTQRPSVDVWAIAIDDVETGGAYAIGSQQASTNMAVSGTFIVEGAGVDVRVNVAKDDTPTVVIAAIVAELAKHPTLPFTAEVNGSNDATIDYKAKNSGEPGNEIKVSIAFEGAATPGLTFNSDAVQLAAGAGNPSIAPVFAAIPEEWFRWFVMPFTDAANLTLLESELRDRFGPVRKIGGRAFIAKSGTHGQILAFGDSRNCEHVSCLGVSSASQPVWLWAAANAGKAASELAEDSSRKLNTVALEGLKPPAIAKRWGYTQRNQALFDGVSTYKVSPSGRIVLERQITMHQETVDGLPDDSRLDITLMEQYEDYRYDQQVLLAPYARHLLAQNGTPEPNNASVMTPAKSEAVLTAWYRQEQVDELGRCQQPENYKPKARVVGGDLLFVDNPVFTVGLVQIHGTTIPQRS